MVIPMTRTPMTARSIHRMVLDGETNRGNDGEGDSPGEHPSSVRSHIFGFRSFVKASMTVASESPKPMKRRASVNGSGSPDRAKHIRKSVDRWSLRYFVQIIVFQQGPPKFERRHH